MIRRQMRQQRRMLCWGVRKRHPDKMMLEQSGTEWSEEVAQGCDKCRRPWGGTERS